MTPQTPKSGRSIVVGLGRTGLSCARYLQSRGLSFAVTDNRASPPEAGALRQLAPDIEMRFGAFDGAAEVEFLRREDEPFFGNADAPRAVGLRHVQNNLLIRQQLVVQREVVAVRVQARRMKRVDDDVAIQAAMDFLAGKNHGGPRSLDANSGTDLV